MAVHEYQGRHITHHITHFKILSIKTLDKQQITDDQTDGLPEPDILFCLDMEKNIEVLTESAGKYGFKMN